MPTLTPTATKYRIWHFSRHGTATHELYREVSDPQTGRLILDALADYDLMLGEDVSWNAQGIEVFRDEWEEWEPED